MRCQMLKKTIWGLDKDCKHQKACFLFSPGYIKTKWIWMAKMFLLPYAHTFVMPAWDWDIVIVKLEWMNDAFIYNIINLWCNVSWIARNRSVWKIVLEEWIHIQQVVLNGGSSNSPAGSGPQLTHRHRRLDFWVLNVVSFIENHTCPGNT